jgi:hypothetical protein
MFSTLSLSPGIGSRIVLHGQALRYAVDTVTTQADSAWRCWVNYVLTRKYSLRVPWNAYITGIYRMWSFVPVFSPPGESNAARATRDWKPGAAASTGQRQSHADQDQCDRSDRRPHRGIGLGAKRAERQRRDERGAEQGSRTRQDCPRRPPDALVQGEAQPEPARSATASTTPPGIPSRHAANAILRQAGLAKAF